jgi:hypothetical protein
MIRTLNQVELEAIINNTYALKKGEIYEYSDNISVFRSYDLATITSIGEERISYGFIKDFKIILLGGMYVN